MASNPLQRALEPLLNRILLLVARGVVKLVNDDPRMQELQLQLLSGEVRTAERFQEYGFSSVPREPDADGAPECVGLFVAGERAHGLIVAVDDRRYRIQSLTSGEVVLYDDQGSKVHLQRSNVIEISTGDGKATVTLDGPNEKLTLAHAKGKIEMDGVAQTIVADAGTGLATATLKNDRIELETTAGVKASVLPGGILLEADASTFINLAPGVITYNAAAHNFGP